MRSSDSTPANHSRTPSRYYEEGGAWFYSTREGEHGPFPTRSDAEADARLYAGLHSHLEHVKEKPRQKPAGG